ncbi:MAG: YdeI/OmpD-associated family protein [Chloroflexota bacterium]
MSKKHTFTATILNAGGGGAFVEVPFDVEAAFGAKKPRVKAMIEGVPYRGTLTRMGGPNHILIILKEIREKVGKTFGDEVQITVELDTEPRVVEIPPELAKAFEKEKAAQAYFNSLAYSHRREYVGFITEAKKEETRLRRVAQTIEMLKKGKRGV